MDPKRWPRPSNDIDRVAALRALGVLDHPSDDDLAAVARVASFVCDTPTAVVNLIDDERQWPAAAYGFEPAVVSRDDAMCGWSILQPGVTYTPDASRDDVFESNPFVTGQIAAVRLYASAPVVTSGHVVGSVCAFAEKPGELSSAQLERLGDLATTAARILELRHSVDTITQASVRDPLTGLFNRSIFEKALDRALALHAEGVGHVGVLYIDLNGFKQINDTRGHAAGDLVLAAAAGRMLGSVRETELVARLGGDEFAIVVQVPLDDDAVARLDVVANRIMGMLTAPVALDDGTEVVVGAAIGRASAQPGESRESLVARADADMYAVKTSARRAR